MNSRNSKMMASGIGLCVLVAVCFLLKKDGFESKTDKYDIAHHTELIAESFSQSWPEELKGIRIPGLLTKSNLLLFASGLGCGIIPSDLYKGINLFSGDIKQKLGTDAAFYMFARGERLFISETIVDYKIDEPLATILFNHFKNFEDGRINYVENDTAFEVKDNRNNVLLSLRYTSDNVLVLDGCFVGKESVLVLGVQPQPPTGWINISKQDVDWIKKTDELEYQIPKIFGDGKRL